MSKITLQYDIVNLTPGDAVPVNSNFTRIEDHINQELIERNGSVAMISPLTLSGPPIADLHAATKAYVDTLVPIGSMEMYVGTSDPAGGKWVIADGRSLETSAYPALFAVIGTAYGGSGGNFNIPDMRGRFPIGVGPSDAIGANGGNRDATLPTHNHTIDHTHAGTSTGTVSADHTHAFSGVTGTENQAHSHVLRGVGESTSAGGFGEGNVADINNSGFGPAFNTGDESAAHNHNYSGNTGGISANHTHTVNVPGFSGSSGSSGTSATNANLPPYRAVNFLIKVL